MLHLISISRKCIVWDHVHTAWKLGNAKISNCLEAGCPKLVLGVWTGMKFNNTIRSGCCKNRSMVIKLWIQDKWNVPGACEHNGNIETHTNIPGPIISSSSSGSLRTSKAPSIEIGQFLKRILELHTMPVWRPRCRLPGSDEHTWLLPPWATPPSHLPYGTTSGLGKDAIHQCSNAHRQDTLEGTNTHAQFNVYT